MSRKEIKVLHGTTVISPTLAAFPPSNGFIKTLVVPKITKKSEFAFEMSIKEGQIIELDSELMSSNMKKAVMECGFLPTDWLVCLTPDGEKRLIRKELVSKVGENESRMFLLKRASEKLLDSLFQRKCTSEIGAEVHVLIGNNANLMKQFADQLIEALKNSDCSRKKAVAAYALNHYMSTNRDLVNYVENKVEYFVTFVREIYQSQNCPPELVDNVFKILEDWCRHFDNNKSDLTKLLNDINISKEFQKSMLKMIELPANLQIKEAREKLKNSVQKILTAYLSQSEQVDRKTRFLVERFQTAVRGKEITVAANVLYFSAFIFEVSSKFYETFGKNLEVQSFYASHSSQIDPDRELAKWFPIYQKREVFSPVIDKRIITVSHQKSVPDKPKIPPKPSKNINENKQNPPPVPPKIAPPIEEPPKPSTPAVLEPKPVHRTVKDIKNYKKPKEIGPNRRFSQNTTEILEVMDKYLQTFNYSDLKTIRSLARGTFGQTYLMKTKEFEEPVVAKMIINCQQLEISALKELANLFKCGTHPHIVRVYGKIMNENEIMGLVLEYMEGGTIFDVIYKNPENYPETQLLLWLEHAASALTFLHKRDSPLIHRDIKPSNLLLTSQSDKRILKLGDFGSLKAIEANKYNEPKTIAGTLGYLAPEIGIGRSRSVGLTPAVDVFSFGITIWEMTQKLRPDEEVNLVRIKENGSERPNLENPRYDWLAPLVSRMWQEDALLRPKMSDVYEEIKRLYYLAIKSQPSKVSL